MYCVTVTQMLWTPARCVATLPTPPAPDAGEGGRGMLRFMHRQSTRWLFLLAVAEMLLLCLSLSVATWLRFGDVDELHHLPARALLFAVTLMLGLAAMGQYQTHMRVS